MKRRKKKGTKIPPKKSTHTPKKKNMAASKVLSILCCILAFAYAQNFLPFVSIYGPTYCSTGTPHGPYDLTQCVNLSATSSIGGTDARCSEDGSFVYYKVFNFSECLGLGEMIKVGSTTCQGGGGIPFYLPYCN